MYYQLWAVLTGMQCFMFNVLNVYLTWNEVLARFEMIWVQLPHPLIHCKA